MRCAGPLPIELKQYKDQTKSDQQLASISDYAKGLMSQVSRCSPTDTARAIWDLTQIMEPGMDRMANFLENGWKEMMSTGYAKRKNLWMVAVS